MEYDIRTFGAIGDGTALDHTAIQAAIDACSVSGGGTVVLPMGTYLSGAVQLRSNVCLRLEMGAVLLGANDPAYYPEICKTPYGNLPGQIQALIWADRAENMTITGPGVVDGGGNSALPPSVAAEVSFRPALVFFRDCTNVKLLNVTLQYSCFWTLHLLRCTDVMVRGVSIESHMDRINTDGIDPDGCRNVIISDCRIRTGDDCIVIKSTEGDVCENITVANCILSSRHAALKIGTEAIGPIRNVTASNCIIYDTNVAIALYMKDGGLYENMLFSGFVIEAYHDFPILVDITPRYYREPKIGQIRSIAFDNLIVTAQGRCYVEGAASQPVRNIAFRHVSWTVKGTRSYAESVKPAGARRVEIDPERINYASKPYSFIAVHVEGLTLSDIRIIDEEAKPLDGDWLYAEQVERLRICE